MEGVYLIVKGNFNKEVIMSIFFASLILVFMRDARIFRLWSFVGFMDY